MALTFEKFLAAYVRVPDERSRRLVPMRPHSEQVRLIAALDARDVAGLRVYREFAISHIKKSGKSSLAAALALWGLVADDLAQDREVIVAATDLAQSKDVVFANACKMVRRNEWLTKHVEIRSTELIYSETVTDPRTGGRYKQQHLMRAVPRDVRGLHGVNPSCLIFDECWAQDDWEIFETLAASPARLSPITAYFSYAGLRSQNHTGNPWHDILVRARSGDDPSIFLSHIGGPDGWRQIPWITQRFIDGERRKFVTVPSKFIRLYHNEWAASESAFLTAEELQAAIDPTFTEPMSPVSGVQYAIGVDLGIKRDWSAVVLAHTDAEGRLTVDAVRTWQGSRTRPVDLQSVEEEIAGLAIRFKAQVVSDAWQAEGMIQRLRHLHRVHKAETVALSLQRHDRFASHLKSLFSGRSIRIPASEHELVEQLENLDVVEAGAKNRRRDLIRFDYSRGQSTGDGDVATSDHFDIVMALALAAEVLALSLGRRRLPDMRSCAVADYWASVGKPREVGCYLWASPGRIPMSDDRVCANCPGHAAVSIAFKAHLAAHGESCGIREFYARNFESNAFVRRVRYHQWERSPNNPAN